VLLLDDVLSELDRSRQTYLIDCFDGVQTIITCTGLEEFVRNNVSFDKIYKVVDGMVYEDV
jgi:DNA replication and repair protein RecF